MREREREGERERGRERERELELGILGTRFSRYIQARYRFLGMVMSHTKCIYLQMVMAGRRVSIHIHPHFRIDIINQ